jgi:regulatory protein
LLNDVKRLRQTALNALSRRDYSTLELSNKLLTKGYQSSDIHLLMTELKQVGLLNEQRFTEHFIHWRRAKGVGPLRIVKELEDRGVPHETIAEQLQITDNEWFSDAHTVWRKQFKGHMPAEYKQRAKQMRFLQYRGFTKEQIMSVFNDQNFID